MYRTVLVPLDGAPFAEHALPAALAVARRAGATLRLVAVATPLTEVYTEGIYVGGQDLLNSVKRQYRTYLAKTSAQLKSHMTTPVTTEVLEGDVASTLQSYAERNKVDLVVMATHGRGPVGRFWLGSTADELVRHLSLPILLVRPGESPPDLNKEPNLGRVILPMDGSGLAEQILEPALAIAGLMPTPECTLLRVIKPTVPVYATPEEPGMEHEARHLLGEVQEIQAKIHAQAESYLNGKAENLRSRGLKTKVVVVVEEQPAVAILHEADARGAGLIALATHGRRGLSRLILGSVADKVIRAAHVPVLVERPSHT
jgi:nucleotide-binding universal stress UspA family protein